MTRRKRRNHSSALKAKVALSALKGDRTLAELAEQFDIHPNQIQEWKKRVVDGAEDVFGGNAVDAQHNEKEVEKLHAKIGKLSMENDFLSKVLGRDQ
jgi:transposase